ncbi:hypothetical protein ACFL47_00990 [Candidatus Latescibacterota bacterium]
MKSLRQQYSEAVMDGFDTIVIQMDRIRKAGLMLAESKCSGGRWMMYDRGYAMSLDTWTRGSNPCDNHIYRRNKKEFLDGDCLILGSYAADDPDDITVVEELRAKFSTRLITISPHRRPNNPRTAALLHTLADVAIDNGTDNFAGALEIEGVSGRILPHAREINLSLIQSIAAEYMQNMIDRGNPPTQFYMVHFPFFSDIQALMNQRIKKYGY